MEGSSFYIAVDVVLTSLAWGIATKRRHRFLQYPRCCSPARNALPPLLAACAPSLFGVLWLGLIALSGALAFAAARFHGLRLLGYGCSWLIAAVATYNVAVLAGEQQIGGSGGSLEPPGPLLEPPAAGLFSRTSIPFI